MASLVGAASGELDQVADRDVEGEPGAGQGAVGVRVEDALALSRTGEFSGTPFYMSPEQITSRRRNIDHRTDIFSLGVTLYEMLTLYPPFTGETPPEVMKNVLFHEPYDPCVINPRVPHDLAVICKKAIEKKPEHRYGSMKELSDDLRRFLLLVDNDGVVRTDFNADPA